MALRRRPLGMGMGVKRAEGAGEILLLPAVEVLVTEEQHLVGEDGRPQSIAVGGGKRLLEVDAADLRADGRLQRLEREGHVGGVDRSDGGIDGTHGKLLAGRCAPWRRKRPLSGDGQMASGAPVRQRYSAAVRAPVRSAITARACGSSSRPYSIASTNGSKPRIRNLVMPSSR